MQNQHTFRRVPAQAQLVTAEEVARRREIKEFTSWKLDLQKYVAADPRLKPADKLVAVYILGRLNGETQITFPSTDTISDEVCIGQRHVTRAIARLRATGWLVTQRQFNKSSLYRFSDKNVNAMIDRLVVLKEARKGRWGEKRPPTKVDSGVRTEAPTKVDSEVLYREDCRSPTLHLKDVHTGMDSQEKKGLSQ